MTAANAGRGTASCDCRAIHAGPVRRVRRQLPDAETMFALADFFRVFGDSTRIGILWALSLSELCVCDLSVLLNMTQSAVSHQLCVLKQARLVRHRREGKVVLYSLDDEHIRAILAQGRSHVGE